MIYDRLRYVTISSLCTMFFEMRVYCHDLYFTDSRLDPNLKEHASISIALETAKGSDVAHTSHQILIELVHFAYISILDGEASYLSILNDPLLFDTLGQWHKAMLETPSDQELSWRTRVLL